MSAPGSRLARQMRPHLGAGLLGEFVAHANRHYKARWLRAFAPASVVAEALKVIVNGSLTNPNLSTSSEGQQYPHMCTP